MQVCTEEYMYAQMLSMCMYVAKHVGMQVKV